MAITFELSADGQTGEFTSPGDFRIHQSGTYGSGTVTVQQEINGTFVDIVGTLKTSDSDDIFDSGENVGGIYRFDLSGSTTPAIVITVLGDVEPRRVFV